MEMKKYGALIALVLAVLFGVSAVLLAQKWLETTAGEKEVVVQESVPLTRIVVAKENLDIGTPLNQSNLTLAQWPKASVPKGSFENLSTLEGRVAVTKLVAGEPLLDVELAAPGSGVGLVALIPPGKRAMTIRVDEVIGVAGFILPNTYVDVIAVGDPGKGKSRDAKTILKRIKVLAIAQETFTEEGKAKVVRTVTMELTSKETERLALQTHQGAIHLVLRNPLEEEKPEPVVEKPKVAKRQVIPAIKPRVVQPAPEPFAVEVIRGSRPPEHVNFKNIDSEERL